MKPVMHSERVAEVFPPGEFIKEELDARGWTQTDLAKIMGRSPKEIHDLVSGKRSVSPEIAKELGAAFSTSPELWMGLDVSYRLQQASDASSEVARRAKLYDYAPIKDMVKRHWIEPSDDVETLEASVKRFSTPQRPLAAAMGLAVPRQAPVRRHTGATLLGSGA